MNAINAAVLDLRSSKLEIAIHSHALPLNPIAADSLAYARSELVERRRTVETRIEKLKLNTPPLPGSNSPPVNEIIRASFLVAKDGLLHQRRVLTLALEGHLSVHHARILLDNPNTRFTPRKRRHGEAQATAALRDAEQHAPKALLQQLAIF